MSQVPAVYRVSLALKDEKQRAGIDFKEMIEDISGAKEEFNALNAQGHRMLLLQPDRKRLNILFKPGQAQLFQPSMLDQFEDCLQKEFDWKEYADPSGSLFEVKVARQLKRVEQEQLVSELQGADNHWRLGDSELEDQLRGKTRHCPAPATARRASREESESPAEADLEELLARLDALVGLEAFKDEVKRAAAYITRLREEGCSLEARDAYPFHYLCSVDGKGTGLTTAFKLLAEIFCQLELCANPGLVEEHVNREHGFVSDHRFDENGVCVIYGAEHFDIQEAEELFGKLNGELREQVVVLVFEPGKRESFEKVSAVLDGLGLPWREFSFRAHSEEELVSIFQEIIAPFTCRLDKEGELLLAGYLKELGFSNKLCGIRTLKDLAYKMMLEVKSEPCSEPGRGRETGPDELNNFLKSLLQGGRTGGALEAPAILSPGSELEEMVGLSAVKARVEELLAYFRTEKQRCQMNISRNPVSMHMIFSGNPGTGKTTVARLVGRIMKEQGILSTGDLIEVTREDLVALYVGHTAVKTSAVIEQSLGSVLFIDEAYSLNGGSERDFGAEALATLVKKMEEHKDDLVVILAGYSEEMKKMVALNPGLSSRVPHQLVFPDYSGPEMLEIFWKLLGSDYRVDPAAEAVLGDLFNRAAEASGREGGNGRFARNVVERLKMKQGLRLQNISTAKRDDLLAISADDAGQLLCDQDIRKFLDGRASKIGF